MRGGEAWSVEVHTEEDMNAISSISLPNGID